MKKQQDSWEEMSIGMPAGVKAEVKSFITEALIAQKEEIRQKIKKIALEILDNSGNSVDSKLIALLTSLENEI